MNAQADRMAEVSGIRLIDRAADFADRTAVIDTDGAYTYGELISRSGCLGSALLGAASAQKGDLAGMRVAFLVPRNFHWVWAQWGIWRAGGVAVPLCDEHPPRELAYAIEDCGAAMLVVHPDLTERLPEAVLQDSSGAGPGVVLTADLDPGAGGPLPIVAADRNAMILYTSGSTGKPKGVVLTHAAIEAQVESLVEAWRWSAGDRILNVLPMHHIHGIVNILTCALWCGACCELLAPFDAGAAWRRFEAGGLTLFMAVPTVYSRLIDEWEEAAPECKASWSAACRRFRLMVSGSAALPANVLDHWARISGQTLLERYGMTEIGMALSNPENGPRLGGFVGQPLPGVALKLVDDDGETVETDQPGEIAVKGKTIFKEYWNRPVETAEAFRDGWFLTGDVACREDGNYRILGRKSVDIIKTGGFKVSALEIEGVIREHPDVNEVAIVGVADPRWGEAVCAAIVKAEPDGPALALKDLRDWARERLARYKIPTRLLSTESLPRNTMGKVTKKAVEAMFEEREIV